MGEINIKRAFKSAKERGIKVSCSEIAEELWGDSKAKTAKTNLSNLLNGGTKKINIDFVPYLCKKLHCTADYLFGITDNPLESVTEDSFKDNKMEEIKGRLEQITAELGEILSNIQEI